MLYLYLNLCGKHVGNSMHRCFLHVLILYGMWLSWDLHVLRRMGTSCPPLRVVMLFRVLSRACNLYCGGQVWPTLFAFVLNLGCSGMMHYSSWSELCRLVRVWVILLGWIQCWTGMLLCSGERYLTNCSRKCSQSIRQCLRILHTW